MTVMPYFSIIITTYNRAHLLPKAITSVLLQNYTDFELIIINGGSTDSTTQVMNSIHDQRIRYFEQDKNYGILSSRNVGFDHAQGKYLFFLDDDDELTDGALEFISTKINKLSSNSVKFFWFDCIDAETTQFSGKGLRDAEKEVTYQDLLCRKIRGDYKIIFNRDGIGDNRFDERLWGYEGLLWLKLHKQHPGYYFPKIIVKKYRLHGVRICNISRLHHLSQYILGETLFLQDFGEELKNICPKEYAEHLSELGFFRILDGQNINGRENIWLSLKYHFSKNHFIFFILSYFLSKDQLITLCKWLNKI